MFGVRKFLTSNTIWLNLSYEIWVSHIYFCILEIFKRTIQTGFWEQNPLLNLCSRIVNSQSLFCSLKAVLKCLYKSFLVYKEYQKFRAFNSSYNRSYLFYYSTRHWILDPVWSIKIQSNLKHFIVCSNLW